MALSIYFIQLCGGNSPYFLLLWQGGAYFSITWQIGSWLLVFHEKKNSSRSWNKKQHSIYRSRNSNIFFNQNFCCFSTGEKAFQGHEGNSLKWKEYRFPIFVFLSWIVFSIATKSIANINTTLIGAARCYFFINIFLVWLAPFGCLYCFFVIFLPSSGPSFYPSSF